MAQGSDPSSLSGSIRSHPCLQRGQVLISVTQLRPEDSPGSLDSFLLSRERRGKMNPQMLGRGRGLGGWFPAHVAEGFIWHPWGGSAAGVSAPFYPSIHPPMHPSIPVCTSPSSNLITLSSPQLCQPQLWPWDPSFHSPPCSPQSGVPPRVGCDPPKGPGCRALLRGGCILCGFPAPCSS